MDPDSLDTIGLTTLKGVLKPNEAFSAHPKTDLNSNASSELLVTFGVQTGPKSTIRLMEFDNAGTNSGELIFDRKDTFNGFAFLMISQLQPIGQYSYRMLLISILFHL